LPPYSPDLLPIEKIWAIIKEKLYNGPQFCTKEASWTAIQNIRVHIHVEHPTLFTDFIVTANYVVSNFIAQKLKSYSDDDFIKQCIECVADIIYTDK